MIELSRKVARTVRTVFRRALKVGRGAGPPLLLIAAADGLRLRARSDKTAIEYHQPSEHRQYQS